ncbi:MAG: iron-containing redox enzyme family protein [Sporichthyaceae bacterium]
MERCFLAELRVLAAGDADLGAALGGLRRPPGPSGLGGTLLRSPDRERVREMLIHRSLYHLKEADPQAWALPRLTGAAKALLAAVEFDEYGGGVPERMHSVLFADLMRDYGLDPSYGAYLDAVPAPMLAVVNFLSLAGLHRRLRGALLGQLAVVEITSPLASQRMVEVVRRTRGSAAGELFYAEHAVADAVHERVMREAIDAFVGEDPGAAGDVLLGIRAALVLDERVERHLLASWDRADTSLRYAIPEAGLCGRRRGDTLVAGPAGGPRSG